MRISDWSSDMCSSDLKAKTERLHISDQGCIALRFSANEKVRERRAGHALLFALVERTKAGDKICLNREGGKQGLAETMDRLDAEAAAAGVENAGKKGA